MKRFEELKELLNEVKDPKRSFIISLLKDFVYLEDQIDKLKPYPRYIVNPLKPTQQVKLPVHEILKDLQAQKNDITTKILRSLEGEVDEESPLMKALKRFEE